MHVEKIFGSYIKRMVVGENGRIGVIALLPVEKVSKKERESAIAQNPMGEVSHALESPRK